MSPLVGNGAGRSHRGRSNHFGLGVSHLPYANDCPQETQSGRNCLEIRFEVFFRYLVAPIPYSHSRDGQHHVDADVCFHPTNRRQSSLNWGCQLRQNRDSASHIGLRLRSSTLEASRPVSSYQAHRTHCLPYRNARRRQSSLPRSRPCES